MISRTLWKRLERLEAAASNRNKRLTVVFADGIRKRMHPEAAISAVHGGDVTAIEGEPGNGNGQLADLLRGLLDEE